MVVAGRDYRHEGGGGSGCGRTVLGSGCSAAPKTCSAPLTRRRLARCGRMALLQQRLRVTPVVSVPGAQVCTLSFYLTREVYGPEFQVVPASCRCLFLRQQDGPFARRNTKGNTLHVVHLKAPCHLSHFAYLSPVTSATFHDIAAMSIHGLCVVLFPVVHTAERDCASLIKSSEQE